MLYVDIHRYHRLNDDALLGMGTIPADTPDDYLWALGALAQQEYPTLEKLLLDLDDYLREIRLQIQHDPGPDELADTLVRRRQLLCMCIICIRQKIQQFAERATDMVLKLA